MNKPKSCPDLDCVQENRNICYRCGWYESNLVIGEEIEQLWERTPTIRRTEEILSLIKALKGQEKK